MPYVTPLYLVKGVRFYPVKNFDPVDPVYPGTIEKLSGRKAIETITAKEVVTSMSIKRGVLFI